MYTKKYIAWVPVAITIEPNVDEKKALKEAISRLAGGSYTCMFTHKFGFDMGHKKRVKDIIVQRPDEPKPLIITEDSNYNQRH